DDANLRQARLETSDRVLDLQAQALALGRIVEGTGGEVADPVAERRDRQLLIGAGPRSPAPPRVEQRLDIPAHAVSQYGQRLSRRDGRILLCVRVVVDQPI